MRPSASPGSKNLKKRKRTETRKWLGKFSTFGVLNGTKLGPSPRAFGLN